MKSRLSVDRKRWETAQAWEFGHWQTGQSRAWWKDLIYPFYARIMRLKGVDVAGGNDWNDWWAKYLNNYDFLPSEIQNYIEIGCGPFTNSRLITKGRTVRYLYCSDPLARKYISFRHVWLAHRYRNGEILLDDHTAEECPYKDSFFDVAVMINVLDHVQDATACLHNLVRIVRPGGIVIFGQDIAAYDYEDTGHPIRLSIDDLRPYFVDFDPLVDNLLPQAESRNPKEHSGCWIFAGKRRSK